MTELQTTHRRAGTTDVGEVPDRGRPRSISLDTVSRRAVPIPDELRGHAEARIRPELLPR